MQESQSNKPEAQQVSEFTCLLYDFTIKWQNGLAVHMAKKHSKIEQGDGHFESYSDKKFADEQNC